MVDGMGVITHSILLLCLVAPIPQGEGRSAQSGQGKRRVATDLPDSASNLRNWPVRPPRGPCWQGTGGAWDPGI